MLRRTISTFYVHRTLTGVTLSSDPSRQKILDDVTDSLKITSTSPAVYWVSDAMADRMFIRVSPKLKASPPAFVPLEEILVGAQATEQEGGVSDLTKAPKIPLFPLAHTDSPMLRPVHVDRYGRKLKGNTQILFESISARRGYNSLEWLTQEQIDAEGKTLKSECASTHPAIERYTVKDQQYSKSYFNNDILVQRENNHNVLDDLKNAPKIISAPASSNILDTLCDVQRSGHDKILPAATSQELLKVKKLRKFQSNRWYTVRQMLDLNLRPKPDQELLAVLRRDGAVFNCYNGDQLEGGLTLADLVRFKNSGAKSMFATSEMERRAAIANIFLDQECHEIYGEDKLAAVKAAFIKRQDACASRQYLTQFTVTQLGYNVLPGSEPAVFTMPSGIKVTLYNRDDCYPSEQSEEHHLRLLESDDGDVVFDNMVAPTRTKTMKSKNDPLQGGVTRELGEKSKKKIVSAASKKKKSSKMMNVNLPASRVTAGAA